MVASVRRVEEHRVEQFEVVGFWVVVDEVRVDVAVVVAVEVEGVLGGEEGGEEGPEDGLGEGVGGVGLLVDEGAKGAGQVLEAGHDFVYLTADAIWLWGLLVEVG